MPLVDVVDNAGAVAPAQILTLVPNANVGVTTGFTVTFTVTGFAHADALGVKVYEPDVVLLTTDGLHVPLIPLLEVVGKAGAVAPAQILAGILKVGVVLGVTVILIVTGKPHCPAAGVNV